MILLLKAQLNLHHCKQNGDVDTMIIWSFYHRKFYQSTFWNENYNATRIYQTMHQSKAGHFDNLYIICALQNKSLELHKPTNWKEHFFFRFFFVSIFYLKFRISSSSSNTSITIITPNHCNNKLSSNRGVSWPWKLMQLLTPIMTKFSHQVYLYLTYYVVKAATEPTVWKNRFVVIGFKKSKGSQWNKENFGHETQIGFSFGLTSPVTILSDKPLAYQVKPVNKLHQCNGTAYSEHNCFIPRLQWACTSII